MMKKQNSHHFIILVISFMAFVFSSSVYSDDAEDFCLDGEKENRISNNGSIFVICVSRVEADLRIHRFTNQNLRVSIKSNSDDLLNCGSSTKRTGVIVCKIYCDMTNMKDRKKRIYEVKLLDVSGRQYYLSKGGSTNFMDMNEDDFSYRFKFADCKAETDAPFPNNIYILYYSHEARVRRIGRHIN